VDNNAVGFLRSMSRVFSFLSHPHFSRTCAFQVALFLLCMPVLAAPLPAIAVLCRSDLLSHPGSFNMISPARLRLERYTIILHHKSERRHTTTYNWYVPSVHQVFLLINAFGLLKYFSSHYGQDCGVGHQQELVGRLSPQMGMSRSRCWRDIGYNF
jgi:hypothetical protein